MIGRVTAIAVAAVLICAVGGPAPHAWAQAKPRGEAAAPASASVADTHWQGEVRWEDGMVYRWTAHFRPDGVLVYGYDGATYDNGRWRQREMLINFDTNQYFSLHVGHYLGDRMEGVAYNLRGERATWAFTRL